VPAAAQFYGPPPPGTIRFNDAQVINREAGADGGLFNAPVRDPNGTVLGYFRRIEVHDGNQPVGVVTLKDYNRTVAVPLERLRFYQPGREVLTDMSWLEMNYIPSGRRPTESPYYPFGRPATG
jgi:hypothetical protein